MTPKIESNSCTEEAFRKIKRLILHQELIPGQKLIYDDLARRLEMSRTPIINALNRLEELGLVVSESRRGFMVKPMDTEEAWETFEMREAIETHAVKMAIMKSNDADFEALEEKMLAYEAYQASYYDRKKIFLDAGFHMEIAQLTRNSVLKWHLKLNMQHLYLRANLNNYNLDRTKEVVSEHRQLFRKIKAKDVLGAVELMRNHLLSDRKYSIACLSENEQAEHDIEL
jgi:DNA-binding GntR family transcriptional regulator